MFPADQKINNHPKIRLTIFILAFLIWTGTEMNGQCIAGNCSGGKGTYLFKDGSSYGGSFKNYFPHGYGKIKYKNGNTYEGYWERGKKHGEGILTYKNGSVYRGSFFQDVISGTGTMAFANGDQYSGTWLQHKMHGKGVYRYKSGEVYEGDFYQGNKHGKGEYRYPNGATFAGSWSADYREGEGTFTSPSGEKKWQKYRKNQLLVEKIIGEEVARQEVKTEKPEALQPCHKTVCHKVKGYYVYGDGSRFEGYFVDGKAIGNGYCRYASGDTYRGEWKDHAPHGTGTMTLADGQKISGIWENGVLTENETKETDILTTGKEKEIQTGDKVATKIFALIVGVATYNHTTSLKYTDDDAYRLYAFLKSPEGGAIPDEQITVLIDDAATRPNILKAMDRMTAMAGEDDVILIYTSGHGLKGSFVPYDFDGTTKNLISYEEWFTKLDKAATKHKLFIADACHSGSMIASARSAWEADLELFYDRYQRVSSGSAFISSSKSEEVSLEYGGLRQGIFSHYLIRGLKGEANKNKDGLVTVGELYDFVSSEVNKYTAGAQNPTISGTYDSGMPVAMVRRR